MYFRNYETIKPLSHKILQGRGVDMQEVKSFIRSRQPVNLAIVAANVIVFIVLSIMGNTEDALFMVNHGAAYTPYITNGEYYRLFTSMFLHFGISHLFFNMLLLIYIGDTLELIVGPWKYLIIYLGGGLFGNIVSFLADLFVDTGNPAVSAGASGAIFAVVGALIWIVLCKKEQVRGYTVQRLMLMALLTVADGFVTGGVDNYAHIGGLLAGLALTAVLYRGRNERRAGEYGIGK
jgi:rhomboid protease GluP